VRGGVLLASFNDDIDNVGPREHLAGLRSVA